MKISFIIITHQSSGSEDYPVRNGHDLTKNCIQSIRDNMVKSKHEYDILLVDNGSDTIFNSHDEHIRSIYRPTQPGGLIGSWNIGLMMSYYEGYDYFIIMNDDILFDKSINDFFRKIDTHKYKDDAFFVPVCQSPNTFPKQRSKRKANYEVHVTRKGDQFPWHGWFVSFNKNFYEKYRLENSKMFDESLPFNGAENLFFNRIVETGGRCIIIYDCEVNHKHLGSWRKISRNKLI